MLGSGAAHPTDEFAGAFDDFRGGDAAGRDTMYDTLANQPDVEEESGTFWADPANTHDASGNALPEDTVLSNLDDYIEKNMNRPFVGLFEDEDGVHVLKENEHGHVVVDEDAPLLPAADVEEYEAAVKAGEEVRGIDFSDLVQAPKVKSGIKGKTNPKASWRVDDTSDKWYKPRQKFNQGKLDEFKGSGMTETEYEKQYGDVGDEVVEMTEQQQGTSEQVDEIIRDALRRNDMDVEATFRDINGIKDDMTTMEWQTRLGGDAQSYRHYWNRIAEQKDIMTTGSGDVIHTTQAGVDLHRVDFVTSEQMQDIELEAITETIHNDPFASEPLLDSLGTGGEMQLSEISQGFWSRAAASVKRKLNQIGRSLFGSKYSGYVDTDAVALEMQNMGTNDLQEALLDGLGDVHALGQPSGPRPDTEIDEFGLDSGEGYQPPSPEDVGLVDTAVDAALDAGIGAADTLLDTTLSLVPGGGALFDAVVGSTDPNVIAGDQTGGNIAQPFDPNESRLGNFGSQAEADAAFDNLISTGVPEEMINVGGRPGSTLEMTEFMDAVNRGAALMSPEQFAQDVGATFSRGASGAMELTSGLATAGKILENLAIMGGLYVPLQIVNQWLDDVQPGLGKAFNWVGAAIAMSTGDPLALLITGAVEVFDTMNIARMKTLGMDDPTKVYGTRVGRVRVGEKWYPAILESSEGDTGLFAQGNKMRMLYGEELVWVADGRGGFRPEMRGDVSGAREFIVDDDVLGMNIATQAADIDGTGQWYNDRLNPMRDWYWFGTDEAADYMSGEKAFDIVDDQPYDNYYMTQMNDWRLAFHQMDKYSDSLNMSRGAYDPEEFDGLNREFSRLFKEHRNLMPTLFGWDEVDPDKGRKSAITYDEDQESFFPPLQQATSQEDYYRMLSEDSGWWFDDHGDMGAVNPFRDMIYQDVLLPTIDDLYKAQYAAANEQGYEDRYSQLTSYGDEHAASFEDDMWWIDRDSKLGRSRPTEWSIWYTDPEKDQPIAQTAAELEAQLATIGAYDDRSRVQQDYLSQKAITRYWMNQISSFGGAQDLNEMLLNNYDSQIRWASPRLAGGTDITNSFEHPMPWQNDGESVIPEDLTNYGEQLDDWWTDRIKEISDQNNEDQGIGREVALEHVYGDTSGWGDVTDDAVDAITAKPDDWAGAVDEDQLQDDIDALMGDDDEQPSFGPDDEPNPVVQVDGVEYVNPLWTEWKRNHPDAPAEEETPGDDAPAEAGDDGPDGPNLGDGVFTGIGDWHEHNDNPFDWTDDFYWDPPVEEMEGYGLDDPEPERDEEPERDPEPEPERDPVPQVDHWGTHGDGLDGTPGDETPTDDVVAAPEAITHASTLDYDTSGYVPMTDALAAAIHAYESPAVKVI